MLLVDLFCLHFKTFILSKIVIKVNIANFNDGNKAQFDRRGPNQKKVPARIKKYQA